MRPSHDALLRAGASSQAVMYDQLGQGLSDPVDRVPTLEELAAVMDAAAFESTTVSAIFDACLAVLVFAAHYPERIDGLVLFNPYAQGWTSAPFDKLVGWKTPEQVGAYRRAWDDLHSHWGRGDSLRMQMPALATARNVRMWGLLERAAASRGMIRTIHQAGFEADVRETLPSVRARALVLRFSGHTLPEAVMRHVAELLPNASYDELAETDSLATFYTAYSRRVAQFLVRGGRDVTSDRVLMTVPFTDIVGSTELAVELGDVRWPELLVANERLVRREVEDAGGQVVKLTGDGSLAHSPDRPVRSGAPNEFPLVPASLTSRFAPGFTPANAEVIDRGIAGIAAHIAARVSAAASVLVTRTVRDLVTGSGIALHSQGERQLKGVDGSWELFAVGTHTVPLSAPDQHRELRATDRVALFAARRAPGLLRAATRVARR